MLWSALVDHGKKSHVPEILIIHAVHRKGWLEITTHTRILYLDSIGSLKSLISGFLHVTYSRWASFPVKQETSNKRWILLARLNGPMLAFSNCFFNYPFILAVWVLTERPHSTWCQISGKSSFFRSPICIVNFAKLTYLMEVWVVCAQASAQPFLVLGLLVTALAVNHWHHMTW